MTVGKCEHKVICLKCCYKLRSISDSFKCIYCNIQLDEVAVIDEPEMSYNEICGNMTEF